MEQRLEALRVAAAEDRNVMPAMLDCARAYCTLFEIRHVLEAGLRHLSGTGLLLEPRDAARGFDGSYHKPPRQDRRS